MKHLTNIFLFLFIVVLPQMAAAQSDTLSIPLISTPRGTSGNLIPINLSNTTSTRSVQIVLTYDHTLFTVDSVAAGTRTSNFSTNSFNILPASGPSTIDTVRIVIFDAVSPIDSIPAGTGDIASLVISTVPDPGAVAVFFEVSGQSETATFDANNQEKPLEVVHGVVTNGPPEISTLTEDTGGNVKVFGDTVHVTLVGTPSVATITGDRNISGTFGIGILVANEPLVETPLGSGIYLGAYVVENGDEAFEAQVIGRLVDIGDRSATTVTDTRITIDAAKPLFTSGPSAEGVSDGVATIIWSTNEPTIGTVQYGITDFGQSGGFSDLATDHSLGLTGLLPQTPYQARVIAVDAAANVDTSSTLIFTTLAIADSVPPFFVQLPTVIGQDDSLLTISWVASEQAIGIVELTDGVTTVRDTTKVYVSNGSTTISGLTPNTTYTGTVSLVDRLGNGPGSSLDDNNPFSVTGTTLEFPDLSPAIFLAPPRAEGVANQSALIPFTTDKPVRAIVDIGLTANLGETISDTTRISDDFTIEALRLDPGVTYFVQVTVVSLQELRTVSNVFSFTTLAEPSVIPSSIVKGPVVTAITHNSFTVFWETDAYGTSVVNFRRTTESAYQTLTVPAFTRAHQVTVPGPFKPLDINTEYDFTVSSIDRSGVTSEIRQGRARTFNRIDTEAPTFLSDPVVTFVDTGIVVVEWSTSELSDSRGAINTTTDLSVIRETNPILTKDHKVIFTGLLSDTRYYFQMTSVDPSGNPSQSKIDSIRTLNVSDAVAPDVLSITTIAADTALALIGWSTTEISDSRVLFGVTPDSLLREFYDPNHVYDHRASLTGLFPGTTYYYRVQSSDLAGNTSLLTPVAPALPKSFQTPTVADKTPPAITQVAARLLPRPTPLAPKPVDDLLSTSTIAEISWNTSEAANTLVRFGQSPDLLLHSVENGDFVRDHLISTPPSLSRLFEGAIRVIYYEVSSTDASGNTSVYPQRGRPRLSLVEAESSDVPAEVIAPPSMGYISDRIGIITWSTNIPTTSQVIYRQVTGVPGAPYQLATRPRLTRNHVVIISNLVPGTSYEYFVHPFQTNNVVLTRVSNGFLVSPKPNSTSVLPGGFGRFTTNLQPDTQAPVILRGPSVIGRNGNALTIQWESDELSTSAVAYGVGPNLDQQTEVGDLVRNHVVTISGLDIGTTYSYRVQSVDPSGNGPSESALSIATTGAQIDITPPTFIDSPTIVGNTRVPGSEFSRVAISWTTDEPADTRFRYGTDDLGNVASRDGFRREHVAIVTGLSPGTGYSGQVAGTDLAGNGPSLSAPLAFTAATDIDNTAPVISSISTALTTNKEITATWRTDEASLSFLRIIRSGTTDTVAVGSNEYRIAHSLTIGDTAIVRPGIVYTVLLGSDDLAGNESFVDVGLITTPTGADNTPPAAPAGLVGSAGNSSVTLSWSVSTEPDLAGYHVSEQLGTTGIGPVTQLASLHPDIIISVGNLTNDLVYTYIVQAVDWSGNVSANSTVILQPSVSNVPGRPFAASPFNDQIVSKKPILVSTVADRPAATPDAVLTYSFVVFSDSLLTSVVASVSDIGEGIPLNPTHWQVVNSAFQDGVALVDNARYWWQVRANSGNVEGLWSTPVSFITNFNKPVSVELASFSAASDEGRVTLEWQISDPAEVSGFYVLRSLNKNGPFEALNSGLLSEESGKYRFLDRDTRTNITYYYAIEAVGLSGVPERFGPISVRVTPPLTFAIDQNYPNPFNPSTTIRFQIPRSGQVVLNVYNILGQEIANLLNGVREAGFHTAVWDGRNSRGRVSASGVYLYRIVVRDLDGNPAFTSGKKMLLIK